MYLRRRDEQVVKKYQAKTLRQCLDGWRNRVKVAKLLCQRTVKFYKRLSFLDVAHGF